MDPTAAPQPVDEPCPDNESSVRTFLTGSAVLPRLRLVQRLAQRWEHPVTLVVAGPGLGKTTMLAQAVRAHLPAPRGVDVWVNCEEAHENPALPARTLLKSLSTKDRTRALPGMRDPVDRDVDQSTVA